MTQLKYGQVGGGEGPKGRDEKWASFPRRWWSISETRPSPHNLP